tara:strand:+ start:1133 stop:1348 length:216 start_codon:yes stop_codon:yes gene_type:complete
MIKRMSQILWGSPAEEKAIKEKIEKSPDPADLTIENAYKTRWIWYHTILGLLMLMANFILLAILIVLAVKL